MITRAQLLYAVIATSVLTLSLLPALGDVRDDGYPFSTYPMFGSRRKTPTFYKAERQIARGTWEPVAPQRFGTNEVMQAVMTVQRAARTPRSARNLCADLLRAEHGSDASIRIVSVTYDPIKYFAEGPKPHSQKILAQCSNKAHPKQPGKKGRGRP